MVRSIKILGLAALAIAAALSVSTSQAQSPTANADNAYEYDAYMYGYFAKSYAAILENDLYFDWQNASSNANEAYSNWFWADQTTSFAAAGFSKCHKSLVADTNTLWDDAADDFEDAINTCDNLLMTMDMSGASSMRISSAMSVRSYLVTAKNAADSAFKASSRGTPPTRP